MHSRANFPVASDGYREMQNTQFAGVRNETRDTVSSWINPLYRDIVVSACYDRLYRTLTDVATHTSRASLLAISLFSLVQQVAECRRTERVKTAEM